MLNRLLVRLGKSVSRRRSIPNRRLSLESLERRALMAAAILEGINVANYAEGEAPIARIINGTTTTAYPSVGLVGDNTGNFCTGTLIAPQFVLTAGHCAEGVANTAGRFQLGSSTYATSQVFVHPSYNSNLIGEDNANDIAIYKLANAVTNIAPSQIYRSTPTVGQLLTLVGFGGGGTGTSGSDGSFGTKRVGTTPIDSVSAKMIRWNFENNSESNTAPGDSGGPAFVTVGGTSYIAGITSGGESATAGIGDKSFDTRVDAFASWIDSIVGPITTLPTVRIAASDAAAAETLTTQPANVGTYVISRTGAITNAMTVNFAISGSATNGSDYRSISTSVTIPAGVSSATITLTPTDDTLVEGSETAILTLSGGTGYSVDGASSTASITIADNDQSTPLPTVRITASDAAAAETLTTQPANVGTYVISRTGATTNAMTVNFAISGSATNGSDYRSISTSVTIPAGASSTTITLTPTDDTLVEGSETAVLTLGSGTGYSIDNASRSASINIADNDQSTTTNNDMFGNRIVLVGQSATTTGNNSAATKERSEPNAANVSGGKSVWWTWTAPVSGTVVITTAGSNFDTTLGVYRGTVVSSLTRVAANDDDSTILGATTSRVSFTASAGTAYQILVDGYSGASGNIKLQLTETATRSADINAPAATPPNTVNSASDSNRNRCSDTPAIEFSTKDNRYSRRVDGVFAGSILDLF